VCSGALKSATKSLELSQTAAKGQSGKAKGLHCVTRKMSPVSVLKERI